MCDSIERADTYELVDFLQRLESDAKDAKTLFVHIDLGLYPIAGLISECYVEIVEDSGQSRRIQVTFEQACRVGRLFKLLDKD